MVETFVFLVQKEKTRKNQFSNNGCELKIAQDTIWGPKKTIMQLVRNQQQRERGIHNDENLNLDADGRLTGGQRFHPRRQCRHNTFGLKHQVEVRQQYCTSQNVGCCDTTKSEKKILRNKQNTSLSSRIKYSKFENCVNGSGIMASVDQPAPNECHWPGRA